MAARHASAYALYGTAYRFKKLHVTYPINVNLVDLRLQNNPEHHVRR